MTNRRTARSPHRWAALTVIVAASIAACTGSADTTGSAAQTVDSARQAVSAGPPTPQQWRTGLPFDPLVVPTEMVAAADRLDLGGLVAGTAQRPALLAAIRTTPQGRRELGLSAWDGASFQPAQVGPDVPGEPQGVVIAGDDAVTAVGGWTWESGTVWPFLVTSTDRRTWTAAQLPAALGGYTVQAVAVDAGRVVALAENTADDAATVAVQSTTGSEPVVTPMPAVPVGQHRELASLAVVGDAFVVTGSQEAANTTDVPRSFVSSDAGRTWSGPAAISMNAGAQVAGVVAVTGGFVATGQDLIPDDDQRQFRAGAWFSADGLTWQAESVPEPKDFRWDGNTSTMGVPRAAGDHVLAIAASTSSRSARPYQRQPTGEWVALTETNQVADGAGYGGQVVPMTEPAGGEAPARAFVAIQGAHGLTVADVRSGQWSNLISPGSYIDPYFFHSALTGGPPGWRAVIRQRNFARFGDDGFRWWYEPVEVQLVGSTLARLPWDPPDVEGADDVRRGFDGSAEVVLANRFTEDPRGVRVSGWYRSAGEVPWQPVVGFGAESYEAIDGVGHRGDFWFAWGSRRPDDAGTEQGMLWWSSDGVTWARADGDFAQPDLTSSISQMCTGPDGRPLAVGSRVGSDRVEVATIWSEVAGRWLPTHPATPAGTRSWFFDCSSVGGRVVVDGRLGGEGQRWQLGADGIPEPVAPPDVEADTRSAPSSSGTAPAQDPAAVADPELSGTRAVSGGFAATGRLDTPAYTGPVLWLSADATDWAWVPVPADRPDARAIADDVDGDLIVLSSSTTTSQAWRIPDIAQVIASIPRSS